MFKFLCLFFFLLFSISLYAEELKPSWELGIGAASYMSPHYLGANQSSTYALPIPFAIYRGERIQVDKGGFFGKLFDNDVVSVRLSLGGSLPVNSEDNDARKGMEDLELMLELGPTIQFNVYKSTNNELRFDIPVRGVFSFGDNVDYRGLIFNPRIYYAHAIDGWRLTNTLGPVFSSEHFHDYIYQVDLPYVTTERNAYNARAGYTGFRYSLGVSKRFGDIFVGSFINYYNLHDAENTKSPLMKVENYTALSIAVTWVFAKSTRLVEF
jgi:outer membrane scaffolding protein for murein synthesis (MipA/OmpV family)